MLEIKRQLSGSLPAKSLIKPLECSTEVPLPQRRLIKSLLTLPRPTIKEEMARRTEAIDAVAAYCQFQEGDTCRLPRNKRAEHQTAKIKMPDNQLPETEAMEISSQTGIPFESALQSVMRDHRPLFCFICLGQKDLDIRKRVQKFSSHGDVTKHIKRKHLQNLVSNTMIVCNVCDEKFMEVMHFQRHANDSHKTVTGPLWCK